MKHLISFRPDVVNNNTAFEAMASIYKYLQVHYGYKFTIIKSDSDEYSEPEFEVVSFSRKDWQLDLPLIPFSIPRLDIKCFDSLFLQSDGVLTVDPTIYEQGLIAITRAYLLNKPVWFDTSLTVLNNAQTLDWRLRRVVWLRKALEKVTGIIATVPKCIERFQDLGLLDQTVASKFTIMGHPVDTEKFMPGSKRSHQDGILRILVVSRMVPEKGLFYILEAIIPLLKSQPRLHLQLLGSGLIKPLLEQEVIEQGLMKQVTFLEPVSHQELPTILRSADVFVNHAVTTSNWEEFFGVANLEAMSCGLPCVLTMSGGISYVIREKDVAVFVDERSIIQLREAITQLLDSKQERDAIAQRARHYVKGYYALPIIAEKYHHMLQRGFTQCNRT